MKPENRLEIIPSYAGSEILSAQLSRYARIALENIKREYPNKPGNVISDASRVQNPKSLHPAFYGSLMNITMSRRSTKH